MIRKDEVIGKKISVRIFRDLYEWLIKMAPDNISDFVREVLENEKRRDGRTLNMYEKKQKRQ
jgi:hypothetical protein